MASQPWQEAVFVDGEFRPPADGALAPFGGIGQSVWAAGRAAMPTSRNYRTALVDC